MEATQSVDKGESMIISLEDMRKALTDFSAATVSTWSNAATEFAELIKGEELSRVVSAQERYELFRKSLARQFEIQAQLVKGWQEGALAAGDKGIARVMEKWRDKAVANALALSDQAVDARTALNNLAEQANRAIASIDTKAGGLLGPVARAAGPVVDAAQMVNGAFEWATTGRSRAFGIAAMGVAIAGATSAITKAVAIAAGATASVAIVIGGVVAFGVATFFADDIYDWLNENIPTEFWDTVFDLFLPRSLFEGISDNFTAAQAWQRPRDPLVLDLDGDGIETVGTAAGVVFDHDGDGLATGTGWVSSDDGLLVLDRNGNGRIDGGAELFGEDTPVPALGSLGGASSATAAHGFAALGAMDSNGDGVVDQDDTGFSALRVWRDLNQNGASEAGELFSLDELGIAAIHTGATAGSRNLGNGNTQTHSGRYVRTDGSEGEAGNLDLASNTFNRRFSDAVAILDSVKGLPSLAGSGKVRDLQEAASLSTQAGGQLRTALTAMAAGQSHAAQMGQLDSVISAWADTSGMQSLEQRAEGISTMTRRYAIQWQRIGDVQRPTYPRPTYPAMGQNADTDLYAKVYSEQNVAAWAAWDAALLLGEAANDPDLLDWHATKSAQRLVCA